MPSTAIATVDYEPDTECLTVTFLTGRVYEYVDVPEDIALSFETAPSKGAFFNAYIRDRYQFREITPAKL